MNLDETAGPAVNGLPANVAIIMDGNGRWAQRRGLPRSAGHLAGVNRLREIVRTAAELGLESLTVFAFSTENWRRPDYEVEVLMRLFRRFVVREVDELDRMRARVRFIGQRDRLPADLRRTMAQMELRTAGNDGLLLQVAVSYGARAEMLDAVRRMAVEVAEGRLDPDKIDEATVSQNLWTAGVTDPDLVIRTSGEMRISNFLLWQSAYAEYAFVEECWPDFTPERFREVLESFAARERRFGAVSAAV
ncbi:di-trans,poly-cis-decaprenylcistransferase [Limibaculum sp. M0105]|uniref:Isoprenyl transferase n=1 Tax=Thermohalobaculum xanthum TaxID=2753746 RepID=A0A8J7SE92_9RHOB|nr:polyprenyl diphosphate synthase [Thermohalobaculum xanthum]MBK0398832.1 di-trans,poly-cis-decaprenylcistransferase [Thermohalobaculum xanthum]